MIGIDLRRRRRSVCSVVADWRVQIHLVIGCVVYNLCVGHCYQ